MTETERRAFTLVELLVVIAIISVLAALLLPTLGDSLDMARQTACANHQRQLHLACTFYAEGHNGTISNRFYGRWDGAHPSPANTIYHSSWGAVPEAIIGTGIWMEGGTVTPDLYFCPGMSHGEAVSTAYLSPARLQRTWQSGAAQAFFASGGHSGIVPGGHTAAGAYLHQTGYVLNWALAGCNDYGAASTLVWGKRRLDQLDSRHPLLADWRGQRYSTSIFQVNHKGKGYNVLFGDGHVRFFGIPQIVEGRTGIASAFYRGKVNAWIGAESVPAIYPNAGEDALFPASENLFNLFAGRAYAVWMFFNCVQTAEGQR